MNPDLLRDERKRLQRELKYNPQQNYVGSGVFMYPKWMPYWRHMNWPACQHDFNYDKHDRSTWSNKAMIEDFAIELILSQDTSWRGETIERHPASWSFLFPMLYFYTFPFLLITVVGRFIDKGRL